MILSCSLASVNGEEWPSPVVTRESRRTLVLTESGRITAVDVRDGYGGSYHLQFITLEPGSLFLPVLLHTDMVFYVHTGRGTVTYVNEDKDETDQMDVGHGDVYRLEQGTVFFVQSHPDPTREKLRIHAIFDMSGIDHPLGCAVRAYSNISDLVQGFDERVLQMGFGASLESIRRIKWAPTPPSIVPFGQKDARVKSKWNEGVLEALVGVRGPTGTINKKKTKSKTFNFFGAKPDVENCNGWSTAVTHKDLKALKGSNLAAFMVNLATGSMMGPHWNPRATEIATVIQGQGMVQVICPSDPSGKTKFKVQEGDVFVVPRFHPMAQVSYNNGTLVFVGFSSMAGKNHPQFLGGKWSVLRTIDRDVLAVSFNAPNASAIGDLLVSQGESVMLACTSCAEEMERKMMEEIERQKQEEERKKEEEAAKRREEEEARRREEEEAKKREEEEAKRREEEETKRREEEEARRREEEEEAAKRREEEEAKRREEEEAKKREEEEAKRREEEETKRREEEEGRKREGEEEARRGEEEETRREAEEAGRREEEEGRKREGEEEARRGEEEEARREAEEAGRREEEEGRKTEGEEETRRREEEEEGRKTEEEEVRRREVEEAKRREKEEAARRREEEEEEATREEETRRGPEKAAGGEEEEARRREEQEAPGRREEEFTVWAGNDEGRA
ncbi:Cupin [Musa troglodytarum]|uniref:Cupin n=1 Tax=Musa troglodytarum TaxID=320322 RepID=A0A9E7FIK0_9LILI|nr:Cupin [Musa troglodytarum]